RAQFCRNLAQFGFCSITIARLLIPERPQRRQRRRPGEPRIGLQNALWLRTIYKVVIDWASLGSERINSVSPLAEIETAAPGVIHKHAHRTACTHGQKRRNALVNWIGRFLKIVGVGIPHAERLVATIERTNFVAQTEVV